VDKCAEVIERDLTFVGATAVEDKLQDGVPETIHILAQAGIKIWILTGDRQETAINIGFSCKLLTEDMSLTVISRSEKAPPSGGVIGGPFETRSLIEKKLRAIEASYRSTALESERETHALVIDGAALDDALDESVEQSFFKLAQYCKAVICCRVSPLQKVPCSVCGYVYGLHTYFHRLWSSRWSKSTPIPWSWP
jgi:phospholipid-transporting ATPase